MRYVRPKQKSRRALILVIALWIAIILSMMALSLAHELRINMKLAKYSMDQLDARALARAGLAKAVMDLRNDRMLAVTDPARWGDDTLGDVWAVGDDKTDVKLGDGTYTVSILDEERKFNLNTMNPRNTGVLGYLIHKVGGIDRHTANVMAFMILDWQDADPFPSYGQGKNETEYWTKWGFDNFGDDLPGDWVFRPKNDFIYSLDELLVVPGITRRMLYGEEERETPKKNRRRRTTPTKGYGALADYITVQSSGQLNINTAPPLVLEALMATVFLDSLGSQSYAKKVTDYREKNITQNIRRTTIPTAAQELIEAGIPPSEVTQIQQIVPIETHSNYFTLISTGVAHDVRKILEARVSVQVEAYHVDPKSAAQQGRRDPKSRGSLRTRPTDVIDPAVRVEEMKDF